MRRAATVHEGLPRGFERLKLLVDSVYQKDCLQESVAGIAHLCYQTDIAIMRFESVALQPNTSVLAWEHPTFQRSNAAATAYTHMHTRGSLRALRAINISP